MSPTKTRKSRTVAIDATTAAALREHRRRQVEERLAWGPPYEDAGRVFCLQDGSPIHPDRFSKWFAQRVRRAGVPPIRLHDVRHSHATLLLAMGTNPKVVQERLGHATITVTMDVYAHVLPGMQEQAAAAVEALLSG